VIFSLSECIVKIVQNLVDLSIIEFTQQLKFTRGLSIVDSVKELLHYLDLHYKWMGLINAFDAQLDQFNRFHWILARYPDVSEQQKHWPLPTTNELNLQNINVIKDVVQTNRARYVS